MNRILPLIVLPLVLCVACDGSGAPPASAPPTGMDHAEKGDHANMDHAKKADHAGMDHGKKTDHAGMDHGKKAAEPAPDGAAMYSCPMHPEVTSDVAGACPKCGMDLVMPEGHDHAAHAHGGDPASGK